jgi:hypothetical protein
VVHFSGLRDATGNFSLGSPASIAAQPKGDALCPGGTFRLEVTASGADKYTYQWFKGTQQIPNARDSVFVIPSVTPQDAGEYSVSVASNCQTVKSATATLLVKPQTRVVEQPVGSDNINSGQTFTLKIRAVGVNRTYQWLKDGFKLNGAVDSFFTIQSYNPGDAGNYSAIVRGDCGADTSASAKVGGSNGVNEEQQAGLLSVSVADRSVTADFTPETAANCTVELTDNLGRILAKRVLTDILPGAVRSVEFASSSLASGVYWIAVSQNGRRSVRIFSIVR